MPPTLLRPAAVTAERFITSDGIEVPAVTADQMREIDRIAMQETGPNLYQMMENAGRSLALEALRRLAPGAGVVVLAGTGGNGGGGICAARHLANRGVDVSLVITDESHLTEIPGQQLDVYRATPGRLVAVEEEIPSRPGLIIDAVIGYSLSGPPRGRARDLIYWANGSGSPILALDVPSGIDATTGVAEGAHVLADWTLTLALPKTGLASEVVGDLNLADIGIPAGTYGRVGMSVSPLIFKASLAVAIHPA